MMMVVNNYNQNPASANMALLQQLGRDNSSNANGTGGFWGGLHSAWTGATSVLFLDGPLMALFNANDTAGSNLRRTMGDYNGFWNGVADTLKSGYTIDGDGAKSLTKYVNQINASTGFRDGQLNLLKDYIKAVEGNNKTKLSSIGDELQKYGFNLDQLKKGGKELPEAERVKLVNFLVDDLTKLKENGGNYSQSGKLDIDKLSERQAEALRHFKSLNHIKGDLNGDGKVDATEAQVLTYVKDTKEQLDLGTAITAYKASSNGQNPEVQKLLGRLQIVADQKNRSATEKARDVLELMNHYFNSDKDFDGIEGGHETNITTLKSKYADNDVSARVRNAINDNDPVTVAFLDMARKVTGADVKTPEEWKKFVEEAQKRENTQTLRGLNDNSIANRAVLLTKGEQEETRKTSPLKKGDRLYTLAEGQTFEKEATLAGVKNSAGQDLSGIITKLPDGRRLFLGNYENKAIANSKERGNERLLGTYVVPLDESNNPTGTPQIFYRKSLYKDGKEVRRGDLYRVLVNTDKADYLKTAVAEAQKGANSSSLSAVTYSAELKEAKATEERASNVQNLRNLVNDENGKATLKRYIVAHLMAKGDNVPAFKIKQGDKEPAITQKIAEDLADRLISSIRDSSDKKPMDDTIQAHLDSYISIMFDGNNETTAQNNKARNDIRHAIRKYVKVENLAV
ncbi:MAG: hypothetical protein ACKO34_00780 [Vampirovibrionales bacterium]